MSTSWLVQASPLSKLFMPEWHEKIEADPSLVFQSLPFKVVVPRTSGALIFEHNKPLHINKIIPIQKTRKKDEYIVEDLEGVVEWLTGGEEGNRSEETDIYGIVGLDIDMDISQAVTEVALVAESQGEDSGKALKTFQEMQKALIKQTKTAIDTARQRADARVKRALRITHRNMKVSWAEMETMGMKRYGASIAEAVGAHILAEELDASGEKRQKMLERMNKVIDKQMSVN